MALAFKRAVSEAQTAVDAANKDIQNWYKPPVNPALVFDFEAIKAIEGVSTQNSNSVEGPKNITCVNWVKEHCTRFGSVWGDVQYKDKQFALAILNQHMDRVVVHVDDKGVAGKYNSYNVEWKGKDLHITVHLDFTNYPQRPNLADDKPGVGHIDWMVWDHLDEVGNITYEIRKANMINSEGSALNTAKKWLKAKVTKKDVPLEVNWDSVFALTGKMKEDTNKPEVPNRACAINLLGDDGKAINSAYWAIDALVKDSMGMEAFLETFDKVVIAIQPGVHADFSGDKAQVTKQGKTLQFAFKFATIYAGNARFDSAAMAKMIEAML